MQRSIDLAARMSQAQGANVGSLYVCALVKHIVDERGDAELEARSSASVGQAIEYELAMLSSSGISELLTGRLEKYRNLR